MKRRSESNFGLHFDLHADDKMKDLGGDFRPEDLEYLLAEVRPDFVQCDTKGHYGYVTYFSALGNSAPGLTVDLLAEWRKCTAKYDTALLSHYSGIWDSRASGSHPDWKQYDENGVWTNENSVFSAYADEVLIPQLKELAGRGMNGAWVDAECWAMKPDFSQVALDAYKAATGLTPEKEGESFEAYKDFCRKGFLSYVKKYVDAVHAAFPDYEIASNWLYTSFCPEQPTVDVDFISGDYDATDSLNTARFEARCLPRQGKPWDLMAWGFNIQNGIFVNKSAVQLLQEIAVPLSLGGGVQVYNFEQGGNVQRWIVPILKQLSTFAREHKVLHKAQIVPQIGVLFSNAGFYHRKKWIFSKYDDPNVADTTGVTLALADAGYGVDVLFTHNALRYMDEYPVLVLPDWPILEPELKERLTAYVRRGGRLVTFGANALRNVGETFGFKTGEPFAGKTFIEQGGFITGIVTQGLACAGDRTMGARYTDSYKESAPQPWCVVKTFGKGTVYAVPFAFGSQYRENYSFALTDMVREILAQAFPAPEAYLARRRRVDVTVLQKDGQTYVTLLNRSGDHENARVRNFDELTPLLDVEVVLSDDATAVRVLETGEQLPIVRKDGRPTVTLPRLDVFATFAVTK